jgi:hypothetical protein
MFGRIDKAIFPDSCEVLEIVPQQHYVYPIFKNGSSSLYKSNYRIVTKGELVGLKNVEIFVRDPTERFLSGVQTYITRLIEENPQINRDSVLYFISNNQFLNRHFCPQVYWLINLKRFTDATITIRPLSELSTITTIQENKSFPDLSIKEYFEKDDKIRFYNEIDEVLTINYINQTVTVEEIITTLKNNYNELYNDVFTQIKTVLNVVS